jgi:hypothetical protein
MTLMIVADGCYAECHLCKVLLMLSVANRAFYAECLYAECRDAVLIGP